MSNARKEKLGWVLVAAGLAILAGGLVFDVGWGITGALPFAVGFWRLLITTLATVPSVSGTTRSVIESQRGPLRRHGHRRHGRRLDNKNQGSMGVASPGPLEPNWKLLNPYINPPKGTILYPVYKLVGPGIYDKFVFPVACLREEAPGMFVAAGGVVTFLVITGYAASRPAEDRAVQAHLKVIEDMIIPAFIAASLLWLAVVGVRNIPRAWSYIQRRFRPESMSDDDWSAA